MIEVSVYDFAGTTLPKAVVTLTPAARGGKQVKLTRDRRTGLYRAKRVKAGRYRLAVKATGFDGQQRDVSVGEGTVAETFMLGKRGMSVYHRGRVPVPFEQRDDLIAVAGDPVQRDGPEELFRELKLTAAEIGEAARSQGFLVLRVPKRMSATRRAAILDRLNEHPAINRAGPVVRLDEDAVMFATNEVVVKFDADVTEEEVRRFASREELEILRTVPYAGNAFLLRAYAPPSYQLLQRFAKYANHERVEYAEPSMVASGIPDQLVPTDFLYPNQWHLPLIDCPEAWEVLRNMNPPGVAAGGDGDLAFGDQDLVIAVMDEGVQSRDVAGVTTPHPDFAGTVTGGNTKMFGWIDFRLLVLNNNTTLGTHGTNCAGVAAGAVNNASTVAGENEGGSGAAGNCRVLGMIHPAGGTELDYADAYIWAGGFNPNSARPGFPAPLSRGADVMSTSYGWFTGTPISGVMRDCFDHLATYGRGGRGVVLFFSAGNANMTFNLQRPWAAYQRNFAIAASDDSDVKAWYSNFGNGIDVCAPSSGGTQGITTSTNVGAGNVAGHTGGTNDYINGFGGTSSATPFTAGVAALMLSANPTLTCIELRELLQTTAVTIDFANTDPTGRYVDTDGDGVADYSQWYGFGRIDALAAVTAARDFAHDIDIVVRENLGDTGAVPSGGAFWNSPDLWVRILDPATDGAAALPANYGTAGPHQNPVAGSATNHVYARVRNVGTRPSLDYFVRIYITHFPGTEFTYPTSFIPTTRPSSPIPSPLVTGTYLIAEIQRTNLAPGAEEIVNANWPAALIPPETVSMSGATVRWHPCLLVEVSPHDGPVATGVHIWDDNNLGQKNIGIVYPDAAGGGGGGDGNFAAGVVIGNAESDETELSLLVDRSRIPPWVRMYVEFADPGLQQALRPDRRPRVIVRERLHIAPHRGRSVVWLNPRDSTKIPVTLRKGEQALVKIGGVVEEDVEWDGHPVEIVQLDSAGRRMGGYSLELRAEGT